MATEYVTNIVVSHHNTWTLIKHTAGSINKAAAKTDAIVYGTQVKVEVKEKPAEHPVMSFLGMILGIVVVFVIFIAYITGTIKGRDCIGF